MAKSIDNIPAFDFQIPSISCPSHFTHPSFQAPLLPPRAQRALSPYSEATASSGRPSPKIKRKRILVVSTFWLFHRRIKATPVHDTCKKNSNLSFFILKPFWHTASKHESSPSIVLANLNINQVE